MQFNRKKTRGSPLSDIVTYRIAEHCRCRGLSIIKLRKRNNGGIGNCLQLSIRNINHFKIKIKFIFMLVTPPVFLVTPSDTKSKIIIPEY
jgi:hypothetical protein